MSVTAFQRRRRVQAAREAAEKEKQQKEKPIDKMTVPELKAYAETNKIDLGDATKKDDILAVIKSALDKANKTDEEDTGETDLEEDEGGDDNAGD